MELLYQPLLLVSGAWTTDVKSTIQVGCPHSLEIGVACCVFRKASWSSHRAFIVHNKPLLFPVSMDNQPEIYCRPLPIPKVQPKKTQYASTVNS
jgi:hypothetical protein